jgi:hypothetical protein
MTQNQNSSAPTLTITIGLFEAVRGEWLLSLWESSCPLSDLLRKEVRELVAAWVAAGGHEVGVETPIPSKAKESRTQSVFPRWILSIEGRRLVARFEWGYFGFDPKVPQPEVPERTVGGLSEDVRPLLGGEILAVVDKATAAISSCGCPAGAVSILGLASEAEALVGRLRRALAALDAAEREGRKATERARLEALKQAGWREFTFRSSYYGSHDGGDAEQVFLFRPGIDLSRWEGVEFSHGEHSQRESNDEFDSWLAGLMEGEDYVEVD